MSNYGWTKSQAARSIAPKIPSARMGWRGNKSFPVAHFAAGGQVSPPGGFPQIAPGIGNVWRLTGQPTAASPAAQAGTQPFNWRPPTSQPPPGTPPPPVFSPPASQTNPPYQAGDQPPSWTGDKGVQPLGWRDQHGIGMRPSDVTQHFQEGGVVSPIDQYLAMIKRGKPFRPLDLNDPNSLSGYDSTAGAHRT